MSHLVLDKLGVSFTSWSTPTALHLLWTVFLLLTYPATQVWNQRLCRRFDYSWVKCSLLSLTNWFVFEWYARNDCIRLIWTLRLGSGCFVSRTQMKLSYQSPGSKKIYHIKQLKNIRFSKTIWITFKKEEQIIPNFKEAQKLLFFSQSTRE